jgi:hypothetical protein
MSDDYDDEPSGRPAAADLAQALVDRLGEASVRADRAEARVRVLEEALVAIRDSREGSFLATTGEGHARCVETARRALASASPAKECCCPIYPSLHWRREECLAHCPECHGYLCRACGGLLPGHWSTPHSAVHGLCSCPSALASASPRENDHE